MRSRGADVQRGLRVCARSHLLRFAALLAALPAPLACDDEDVLVPADERSPDVPAEESSGRGCSADADCGRGSRCEFGYCVGLGVLQVTLSFDVNADFDLHVRTPVGEEISWHNDIPWDHARRWGGVLDVDQCVKNCGSRTHVENVYFVGAVPPGSYAAWVKNFDGRDGGAFHLEVRGLAEASMDGVVEAEVFAASEELAFRVGPPDAP